MPQTDQLNLALSGRYVIERELGQGGTATVYPAHDVRHDRKVALKVLRPELAAVIGAERFLQEIKVTASLQHPHILPSSIPATPRSPVAAAPWARRSTTPFSAPNVPTDLDAPPRGRAAAARRACRA
jgi:serine/threonine protein kinase